jgi:formylmethanofuran dehydrogenase subunit A
MDMGQVTFTDTTTMTADGPAQFGLYNVTGNKWVNHDVGAECAGGIVPIRYKRTSPVNALQWSIGLEMALLVKDPWKIFMTTDHPNGGPFTLYPKVISWLMSKAARDKVFKKLHKQAKRKSLLPTIDRELTLYELAVMTRAGTAKVLGMKQKGHLGVGADADVAVYNINPKKVDIAKKYLTLRKALKRAAYTIKAGEVVVKDGEVVKEVFGNVHHLNIETKRPADAYGDLQERFKDYVTLEYENYPIQDGFVHNPISVPVKAGV